MDRQMGGWTDRGTDGYQAQQGMKHDWKKEGERLR